ncbi:murein DD-endopeptidase MepM/ murein hydrolase activator NlpD [Paenibacillus shirakamiensis]|uniref:Murein DD-endopeptidase MepM/ murein hydrolase activator NlpD n=1 Tax=Paenibacillus shirakamiensis TaxID=1265935 RepID=A0ABS4JJ70_9BACL|nr:peptidoglycan DD-metalloendopeptidase family protein [Paenibacillus shirakamiensis]MBP2001748.1 murein DD-endopeptidase MepM/ murein hydrolase activator NlpD [Paenibacillus shirakamiensis]
MKKWLSVVVVTALASVLFVPSESYAKKRTVDQIDHELRALQQQAKQAQTEQQQADSDKQDAAHYKNKATNFLQVVLQQIDSVSGELSKISADIDKTESDLHTTAEQIDQTQKRIDEREKLLDSRIRLMYTDGVVSYLDVLLSSTSFTDFLDRADSLQAIAQQDQNILEDHKKDKALIQVEQKKLQASYSRAKLLYAQAASRRATLAQKEKEKESLIASYQNKIEQSDDISADQDKLLVSIASKRAQLAQEKNKIKAAQIYAYNQKKKAEAKAKAEAAANAHKVVASTNSDSSSNSSEDHSSSGGGFTGNGGSMALPVSGARISSPFGYRIHPITGAKKLHTGTDFAVGIGTDVHAADNGVVIVAEWWSGYGNCVIIDHGNNVWTLYGHLSEIKVQKGDNVQRGSLIAESGNTGASTGPHLHFEVRLNGTPVDAMPYL